MLLPIGGDDDMLPLGADGGPSTRVHTSGLRTLVNRWRVTPWRRRAPVIAAIAVLLQWACWMVWDVSLPHLLFAPSAADQLAATLSRVRGEIDGAHPNVAFAIPVGGRTERSANLRRMLTTLVEGGVRPGNIFIFEDQLSRPNGQPSPAVATAIGDFNRARGDAQGGVLGHARVVPTHITRQDGEDANTFGIHLARHYKYMLDYMLADGDGDALQPQPPQSTSGAGVGPPFDFVVVLEDDLLLAPDTAKFFQRLAAVMQVDDTLYCVAAHQDNAFKATSAEEGVQLDGSFSAGARHVSGPLGSSSVELSPSQFAFRRGNHFMAPGWMTSRRIYTRVVQRHWLDAGGQYREKQQLHLKNGHWDRFFDALIRRRDCLFPEVPRITHEGADGFTVSKKGQMELYTNLRLSSLPVSADYGDLSRLTIHGYDAEIRRVISGAIPLLALEDIFAYRHSTLVYSVPARDQMDSEWNAVANHFFGVIGVGGYGGYEGYVKARGIWRGVVLVRCTTNLVVLVGSYSEYAGLVAYLRLDGAPAVYRGCVALPPGVSFAQSTNSSQVVAHYTRASLDPLACLHSCRRLGYQYAALSSASMCQCVASDLLPLPARSDCWSPCLYLGAHSAIRTGLKQAAAMTFGTNEPCGGTSPTSGALYALGDRVRGKPSRYKIPSEEQGEYLLASAGQTCTDACAGVGARCEEQLFPELQRSCAKLSALAGCTVCTEEDDIERGFATPGVRSDARRQCVLGKGKTAMCSAWPPVNFRRACVCVRPPTTKAANVGGN